MHDPKGPRQQHSKRVVAIAKAALEAGLPAPRVSAYLGVPVTVLHAWRVGRGHPNIKPDAQFPARLAALFKAPE